MKTTRYTFWASKSLLWRRKTLGCTCIRFETVEELYGKKGQKKDNLIPLQMFAPVLSQESDVQ